MVHLVAVHLVALIPQVMEELIQAVVEVVQVALAVVVLVAMAVQEYFIFVQHKQLHLLQVRQPIQLQVPIIFTDLLATAQLHSKEK